MENIKIINYFNIVDLVIDFLDFIGIDIRKNSYNLLFIINYVLHLQNFMKVKIMLSIDIIVLTVDSYFEKVFIND